MIGSARATANSQKAPPPVQYHATTAKDTSSSASRIFQKRTAPSRDLSSALGNAGELRITDPA